MAIDPHYIPAFSIENVLLDRDTGAPLSGGKVYFLQDNQPTNFKAVYQIVPGAPDYTFIALPDPMILSAIGTFEDSLGNPTIPYFYPFDANGDPEYYQIQIYSSGGVLQETRLNQPYIPEVLNPGDNSVSFANELTNPQFSIVNFDATNGTTYSFQAGSDQEINLAPSWELVVNASGVGSVIVSQTKPPGTLNVITNPGTILNIQSTGLITSMYLRQRIVGSPNLWASGFVSATFVAKTFVGVTSDIIMTYSDSNSSGTPPSPSTTIITATLPNTDLYTSFSGAVAIPASTNPDTNPTAYVDINLILPLSTVIEITSIQLVGTNTLDVLVPYDQTSNATQLSNLFYYYEPDLVYKPIPSYMTGWDFSLNPAQFGTTVTAGSLTTPSFYAWDQTIVFEGTTGGVGITGDTDGQFIMTAAATGNMAIIQYLSGAEVTALLLQLENLGGLSCGVLLTTTVPQNINVSLWYSNNPSFPDIKSGLSLVTSLDSNGHPSVVSGWNEIIIPDGTQTFITEIGQAATLHSFNGFSKTGILGLNDKFAIVVGFNSVTMGDQIYISSVSLVPGYLATIPAPQSVDEVLRECQYYYEQSYDPNLTILNGGNPAGGYLATPAGTLAMIIPQSVNINSSGTAAMSPGDFSFNFITQKVHTPAVIFYSYFSGTVATVWSRLIYNNVSSFAFTTTDSTIATYWTISPGTKEVYINNKGVYTNLNSVSTFANFASGSLLFNYTADSRLGTF